MTYGVRPNTDVSSGTKITNQAEIICDFNDPIITPLVRNTLDAETPTSHALPLPKVTTETTFELAWTGEDEASGSGIAGYDVYVAVDDGSFGILLANTRGMSFSFDAEPGRTYRFYTIARDNVGHFESPPEVANAHIEIVGTPPVVTGVVVQRGFTQRSNVNRLGLMIDEKVSIADLISHESIVEALTLVNLGECRSGYRYSGRMNLGPVRLFVRRRDRRINTLLVPRRVPE